MGAKITINSERCKGCGLCITVCNKHGIAISAKSNKTGYFPAEKTERECSGCGLCAIICPDAAIEVYRNSNITGIKPQEKKPKLVKEKA
jgi:2-oxoglutarate ferredoxin oxidoreductase subunit delta